MRPEWLRIVQDYPGNNVGPTIPFLLAALRKPVGAVKPEVASRAELLALLISMRDNSPSPWRVVIQPCGGPEKLVVTLTDIDRQDCVAIRSGATPGGVLYCHPLSPGIHDVDDLLEALWSEFGESINRGRFSYVAGEWRQLSDVEITNIGALLKPEAF